MIRALSLTRCISAGIQRMSVVDSREIHYRMLPGMTLPLGKLPASPTPANVTSPEIHCAIDRHRFTQEKSP
jgi:hypothetical protein